MAIGKAAKRARNLINIIQPKLDKAILTDEYFEEFKNILDTKTDKYFDKEKQIEVDNKFKMYVYNHELLEGVEMTKADWMEWLTEERKVSEF